MGGDEILKFIQKNAMLGRIKNKSEVRVVMSTKFYKILFIKFLFIFLLIVSISIAS